MFDRVPERFAPYFGALGAVFIVLFVVALTNVSAPTTAPAATEPAFSDLLATNTVTPPPQPATTSTQKQKNVAQPVKQAAPMPAPKTPAPTEPEKPVDLDPAAAALRGALVNVICYAPAGSKVRSISGSGIVIDPKGIVLTNAHIAQHFLLKSEGVSCSIRAGSPAVTRYDAALIYLPAAWIEANAKLLTKPNPTGTGERDFALLAITRSLTSEPLPATYPFVPLAVRWPSAGTPVVIASYAAQFLGGEQIRSALFPTIVFGRVETLYTFGTNTADVIALGGSAAAQEGSSGGGVASEGGTLLGTITTSTTEGDTSARSLDAITASYIRAAYASDTGSPIDVLLAKPTAESVADFAPRLPELEAILTAQLQ